MLINLNIIYGRPLFKRPSPPRMKGYLLKYPCRFYKFTTNLKQRVVQLKGENNSLHFQVKLLSILVGLGLIGWLATEN